jgi:transposase-like protein
VRRLRDAIVPAPSRQRPERRTDTAVCSLPRQEASALAGEHVGAALDRQWWRGLGIRAVFVTLPARGLLTLAEHTTISVYELFKIIPDAESARLYLESRLWPNGPTCPVCAKGERITARKGGYYRCNACREDFTVRTGTIFERSHIPLHKWVYAMYLLVTARKGISSVQLSKEIGVTQKSAWFMLHRLREACSGNMGRQLRGIVEIDETYVGGLEKNRHEHKKLKTRTRASRQGSGVRHARTRQGRSGAGDGHDRHEP